VGRSKAMKYRLSYNQREKPTMGMEDVLKITETTLKTVEKMFQVGRCRIQVCFFLQGGFITANRPAALLQLRYRDIKVVIERDPDGGPNRIVLRWTYAFTKTYLGPKPEYVCRVSSDYMESTNVAETFFQSQRSYSIHL
jgi:hypothetical protein